MNFQFASTAKKPHESKFEVFHIRQNARLCIGFVCLVHFFSRFTEIRGICQDNGPSRAISRLSLPFGPIITLIVAIEYILVRRKGSKILKYSQLIDLIILFLFTADWILGLVSAFTKSQDRGPRGPGMGMHQHDHDNDHGSDGSDFQNHRPGRHGPGGPGPGGPGMSPDAVMAIYQFVNFAWKALLVTLIVQKWQLKIIAPSAAIITATVYACIFDEKHIHVYIIRCAAQLFNTTFIIYCEDRIKWKIIWTTLQQEKWMQVNNFILNNIPENIMILDVNGQVKFISDYCKSFMEKCNNLSLETKEFFSKIQNLHQQKYELDPPLPPEPGSQTISGLQMEKAAIGNNLLSETAAAVLENNPGLSPIKVETLTDLIMNFKDIAKEKNLQEKQFLIYNGKLKTDQHEKSIEIKVSFIQHFEDDYVVLILRDTTQRDLLVTLEETNKYKDQLLASVSHELRAPLNGNINLVESAINSRKIPGHIKETLLIPALRSSKFLLHIINDILDMSQIKEKKLRLTFQNKDLQETFKSTAQLVELQAKKKGIELLLEFDPHLPQNFCTDHVRVSQIVLNLLNNAMKFTKEGTIKLIAEPTMDNPKWVKISVIDSGIGMSQENVKKLFSNYTHIEFEGRQSMNPTGVGLGLNIAYNLVQLLSPKEHQTIEVVSAPNQGSTFSFVLEDQQTEDPLQMDQIEDLDVSNDSSCRVAADEASTELKSKFDLRFIQSTSISMPGKYEFEPLLEACSCPKVLIVDDNPFNTMAFETILNSLNMKCDSVYSGSCAIEKLLLRETKKCGKDCKPYSTVFMDQEMPEMDGIQTTKEIRRLQGENSLSQEMKIIGCTAHHSKQEVDKFVEAGLDKCIHKPISASMINDIL